MSADELILNVKEFCYRDINLMRKILKLKLKELYSRDVKTDANPFHFVFRMVKNKDLKH